MSNTSSAIRCLALSQPKSGSGADEYEDASASNLALNRFAVADGATESSYAGLWARMLVEEFVSTPSREPGSWATWLPQVQARWELAVGHRPLPWYAEIKWQQGAFATFLGLVLQPPHWEALAVGDSCLFHIRGRKLLHAFPIDRSAEFSTSPWLVGSRGFTPQMMVPRELRCGGDYRAGDRLWLMTDALAHWFLVLLEAGQQPWELLEPLLDLADAKARFTSWIAALRGAHQIRNDDVTLLGVWGP
jgi:hypothetical protein